MKKKQIFHFFCVFILILILSPLCADERTDNIDVFIVLDKSLSMEEEIEGVKSYVKSSLIEEVLIPGDYLVVIAFYGEAETLIVREMVDEATRASYLDTISLVKADGRFTDIGNALDALRDAIPKYGREDKRKYLLLITDGKQEAPPDSIYYSEDGSFNHAFLENTRTIQKEGWKIHILGIGTASAAKEIAEELSGGYTEITEEPTEEVLKETTGEFLGRLEVADPPVIGRVDQEGNAVLSLSVESYLFTENKTVIIRYIDLAGPAVGSTVILEEPYSAEIPAESSVDLEIPVLLPENLDRGDYDGTVTFVFDGDTVFVPAVFDVSFSVKGFFGNNVWIIPVIAVVAAGLIALLIFLLLRGGGGGKGISFRLYVDNKPVNREPIKLKNEEEIFIKRDKIEYVFEQEKSSDSISKVTTSGGLLTLSILDKDKFRVMDELPEGSITGKKFRVKNEIGGGYKTFLFRIA